MRTSKAARDLLVLLEGSKSMSYQDGGGVWTIGVGHILNVGPDQTATEFEIAEFLRLDMMVVDAAIKRLVTVELTQGMLDALSLFAFNVGVNAFATSTLLKKLNGGQFITAREGLANWVYDNGKPVHGLKVRRAVEELVWIGAWALLDERALSILRRYI